MSSIVSRKGRKQQKQKKQRKQKQNSNPSDRSAIGGSLMTAGFSVPAVPLFGMRTRKTLRYFLASNITSGASTAGTYVMSANGAYDPDITGTGGQPMGFDQMMVFYNHYTVIKSKIKVVFQTNSASLRASVALSVNGASTTITNIEQLVENGNLTFQLLEYSGSFGGACTLHRAVNAAKFQGIDDVMDDPNMRGDAASNPTEQLYYHLSVWNSASATTISVDFQAMIEFDVMFHEPRKASLSDPYVPHHPVSESKFEVVSVKCCTHGKV